MKSPLFGNGIVKSKWIENEFCEFFPKEVFMGKKPMVQHLEEILVCT